MNSVTEEPVEKAEVKDEDCFSVDEDFEDWMEENQAFVLRCLLAVQKIDPEFKQWILRFAFLTNGHVSIGVFCSDFFWWGTADDEKVTPENIGQLEKAIEDAGGAEGPLLFCARIRQLRPQGCCYGHLNPENWHLFDAAGPERGIDFSNPYAKPAAPGEKSVYEYKAE